MPGLYQDGDAHPCAHYVKKGMMNSQVPPKRAMLSGRRSENFSFSSQASWVLEDQGFIRLDMGDEGLLQVCHVPGLSPARALGYRMR